MPTQMQGFNDKGESEWFNGNRLPEGWSYTDPTLKAEEEPEPETPFLTPDNLDFNPPASPVFTEVKVIPETVPDTPDVQRPPVKRRRNRAK